MKPSANCRNSFQNKKKSIFLKLWTYDCLRISDDVDCDVCGFMQTLVLIFFHTSQSFVQLQILCRVYT